MWNTDEVLDMYSASQNDMLDYRIKGFVENVYDAVSQRFSRKQVEELKEDALKELLTLELVYIQALEDAELAAEEIISKLSSSQMDRLLSMVEHLISTSGMEAIDYKSTHYPVLLTTIQTVLEAEKTKRGKRYCPACGSITSSKEIQCEKCHTYLTTDKPMVKLRKIINSIVKSFLKRKNGKDTSNVEYESQEDQGNHFPQIP